MVYEEKTPKKNERVMFRIEYDLMNDINKISQDFEDTLSRTSRMLLRLGIKEYNRRQKLLGKETTGDLTYKD
ncbi:MAG: hypothetical protein AABX19_01905 [Nanoarchaeota archaeon]